LATNHTKTTNAPTQDGRPVLTGISRAVGAQSLSDPGLRQVAPFVLFVSFVAKKIRRRRRAAPAGKPYLRALRAA
jgi:hypothetical protein